MSKRRKKNPGSWIYYPGVFLILVLSAGLTIFGVAPELEAGKESKNAVFSQRSQRLYRVLKVLDGDSLLVDKIGEVRLIGVDTPEMYHPLKPWQYFAREASDFVRKQVEGQQVRLAFDKERQDKYGRTLAYVYLPDGRCLNEEIIRQGYGFALTRFPFRYKKKYEQLEEAAKKRGLGLWANGGLDEYRWLLAQKIVPYEIFEMTNNWWGIRYKEFVRLRLDLNELTQELKNLRVWTNELSPSDLEKKLLENGWRKVR
ncbi:MAG: thermonuclease family protein [Candidatus Aminicenantes bacterium]|nr:thermonuclease family protein [Candidatus Aminicenantes bacterium]